MKDLTGGSIVKNILQMAVPIAARMLFQMRGELSAARWCTRRFGRGLRPRTAG
jgi:hypothetical protein